MKQLVPMILISALVAGCGSTDKDRAVSGAGIGAGIGATTGLVIGGAFPGLIIGGAFGAATGLVTDEDTIDLGDPLWARKDENGPEDQAASDEKDGPTPFDDEFTVLE